MARVVIFGNSDLAEVAHFYLSRDSDHELIGFTVDRDHVKEESFHGMPVVPYEEVEKHFPPERCQLFMPIGYKQVNRLRASKYEDAKARRYTFISYISSKSIYYGTPVGENCLILEANVIQPFSSIGNNCVMWSGGHLGHHSVIGDHCFLAPQVVVSGSVNIGEYTFVGANATIRDNVRIGRENIIGAGSVVLRSTADCAVYSGGNAEKLRWSSHRLASL